MFRSPGDENDIAAPNAPLGKLVHNLSETVSDGVDAWLKAGIPANRLSLGVPFYGLTFKMAGNGKAMYDRILHPQPQGDQVDMFYYFLKQTQNKKDYVL